MKKLAYIFLALSALALGLTACEQKEETATPKDYVELRYRVADNYDLDALSPKAITILVTSTKPWTIRSQHPDWCIISEEDGEGQVDTLVHTGKAEITTVKVQYYDNTGLDDRTDIIEIASSGYIGKKVTIVQKGSAYLAVPGEEQEQMIEKAGGEFTFHVLSNQPWTSKITEITGGNWLSIKTGASGEKDGEVHLSAAVNSGEKRYATVTVYDRLGVEQAAVKFTQDGVQLDPATFEIRAGYDQLSASLDVVSNTKWQAKKASDSDDWFEILNPDGHEGDGTLNLSLQEYANGSSLRTATIILQTVAANPDDAVAEKEIVLKQAYRVAPVRKYMDNDELGAWTSDWANAPVYTKDYGTLFVAKCRLNQSSMPFGTYTFRWKDIYHEPSDAQGIRIRHWLCFGEGCELKYDIRPQDGKISASFNKAGDGNEPSVDSYYDVDFSQPIEITYKFDPSGSDYCHVTYLVNGKETASYDTSENMLRTVTWGKDINMYIGLDNAGSGSAVLEWYEYTKPISWDE